MSDVEARREARRRKILENSGNRLQRITGVQQRKASYELEGYRTLKNNENETRVESHSSNIYLNEYENHAGSSNLLLADPQLETIHRNHLLSLSFDRNSVSSTEQITLTKSYKTPIIVGIAGLLNLLQVFFYTRDFLVLNNIFVPLLCFEAVYLFYNLNSEKNNGITNILSLFCRNIPPRYLSLVIKYFTLFFTITRDVMIYFFAYVCIWFIFNVLYGILSF